MLIKRAVWIAILLLVGFAISTISLWTLAFSAHSSDTPLLSARWFLQYLPLVIGIAILVVGFRMLGSTRVATPLNVDDDPAP